MGGVSDDVLLARAYLSRIAEPGNIPVWELVGQLGPVGAVAAIRRREVSTEVSAATSARLPTADAEADLAAAERHGIRLVTPEHDEWPHYALGALERAGHARVAEYRSGRRPRSDDGGEPIPPLALWVKGAGELAGVGVRSIGIVGSRAATSYGNLVARELAFALASRDVPVVSGGAYGIDGAAHTGALAAGGVSVAVSAGGLDRPYPAGHAGLFERVAERGLLISESPPGAAPQRQRFLTRNRLIAAFGTGTVVVEAARRSGARNTVTHCRRIGRPVMAVPGPVTSPMSAGCHDLIRFELAPAILVTCADDVLAVLECPTSPEPLAEATTSALDTSAEQRRQLALDSLEPMTRRVFDGLHSRQPTHIEEIAARSGVAIGDVIRSLPILELHGVVTTTSDGYAIVPVKESREPPRVVS